MQGFFGEELRTLLPLPHCLNYMKQPCKPEPLVCRTYGHNWLPLITNAEIKQCCVCGLTGYCPGCVPVAPTAEAQPFFCTRHTPGGGMSSAESEAAR